MSDSEISVYGGFPEHVGIHNVAIALQNGFPYASVNLYELGGLGPTLHFRIEKAFFATLYMEDENLFLFDGGVTGTVEDAVAVARGVSEVLSAAHLEHDLRVSHATMECDASFAFPPTPPPRDDVR